MIAGIVFIILTLAVFLWSLSPENRASVLWTLWLMTLFFGWSAIVAHLFKFIP